MSDVDNAATMDEIRREVIRGGFTGRVVIFCTKGRIEGVEVTQRRPPVLRENGRPSLDEKQRQT